MLQRIALVALMASADASRVLLRPRPPAAASRAPAVRAAATFSSIAEHEAALERESDLPSGFRVGVCGFEFPPVEVEGATAVMNLTVIALDEPSTHFAAVFTRNAFPGAPIKVGRKRLASANALQAVVVNNKISNVCAGGDGVGASEAVCAGVADALQLEGGPEAVLPCSTGIIGWRLPTSHMLDAIPSAVAALSRGSALPAAKSIMTTDRFPKLRSASVCGGTLVGFAKGAGMIEPNMATMLAFVLTDVAVPREQLQPMLARAAEASFNCASVDADQSTSDTLACLSSATVPFGGSDAELAEFEASLTAVCQRLAEDVVRNGEGTAHVIRVDVRNAPTRALARGAGKAVVNSPLFKSAVAGNDPNVGRLVSAVGSYLGREAPECDLRSCTMRMGGRTIFEGGTFDLDPKTEDALFGHLKEGLLTGADSASLPYPPHERCVEIEVDLGAGAEGCVVHGSDLTKEYVSINADYRS